MQGIDPDLRALQETRDLVQRARAAMDRIRDWDQSRTDQVVAAMAEAGARAAGELARLAVEETGIGRVHYKILKNLFGSEGIWESIRDEKTVGVISRDSQGRVLEVAAPSGVIAGIIPTTNPTSTALGKSLIAVKGKNAIVISPHPRAKRCIMEAVEVLRRALERMGVPADLVTCASNPTIESTGALMKHKHVALILSTGGPGLVKASYSSGKPAYGVGPGNVPVYIDRSANVAEAARWIIASQSFDNATLCCSEQALVLDRPIASRLLEEMQRRGAHLCSDDERAKLERYANQDGHMNADMVGVDPAKFCAAAGFRVPPSTSVVLAHQDGVGREHPLSIEILCPLLSIHVVDGWEEGCRVSKDILHFGGLGHTVGVWARDNDVLEAWFLDKPGSRIVANGPTAQGAVGYSSNLVPSMSLGCGPAAGNITSDNISARHLVTIKRVAWVRNDWIAGHDRDHERARELGGERAPRGSGLPLEPALGAGSPAPADRPVTPQRPPRVSEEPKSNWGGNPPVAVPSPAASSPAAASSSAPRFTAPAPSGSAAPRSAAPSRPVSAAPVAASRAPYQGMALKPQEIEGILEHAGAGCPLGPCQGCPHQDVHTGSCTA